MRKLRAILFLFIGLFLFSPVAKAQVPHWLYGASPFQDSLWAIDTTNWSVVQRTAPSLSGFTITGITGMAFDPETFETFAILKLSGVTGRVLGKINLATGVCTQVGNLGDNFSSLTFDCTGQLWGATGNGATVPETLYKIDKTNASKTLITAMGSGADGEIICYNPGDNFIYHWSGNSTVVFEKILSNTPYTITNIPIIGTAGGETFGAVYIRPDQFITSTISSNFRRVYTSGNYFGPMGSNPDDLRGLVLLPKMILSNDTICEEVESVTVSVGNLPLFSNMIYSWGDGNSDTISNGTGNGTHVYNAPGNYTIAVQLGNGCVRDTFATFTIHVNNIPLVTVSGSHALCPNSTITLTGSSGGSSQWYLNGVIIPGATTNTLSVSAPGAYNMTKTNLNGCADSSHTSFVVNSVPNPVVNLGADATVCGSVVLDAQNPGATYAWSTSGTQQTETVNSSGTYSVTVTDLNGCSASDTIALVVNSLPVVNLGSNLSVCGGTTLDAQNPGATYAWSSGGTQQTETISSSGTYSVVVTDANNCSAAASITVTVNSFPVVNIGPDTTVCGGITLDAQNAGATYAWSSGGTQQMELANSSGTYSVVVTDGNNCSSSDSVVVTVNAVPVVGLGADTTVCGSITLDAQNPGATYTWSSGGTQQTETITASGSYAVTVTANGCSANDAIVLTVNPLPAVTLAIAANTICVDDANVALVGTPSGGVYSGTSVSGSQFDPSVGAGTHDTYYAYTDGNGCSATDTLSIIVSACTGIGETSAGQVAVYPNPGAGLFYLSLPEAGTSVFVTDMLGKLVFSGAFENAGPATLDLSAQAEGVYFVRLAAANGSAVARLVISR